MRSIQIQVPSDRVDAVLGLAREHGAAAPIGMRVDRPDEGGQGRSLVLATIPNEQVGRFIQAAGEAAGDAGFVLMPVGALVLQTPLEEIGERVQDVSRLSTLELVLGSLQSIGAWRGMLLFSVLAGIIGGYGLIFDVTYLLVAAMLVNPMGAPALVAVTGMAVGNARVFGRGALRFFVSLLVQALAALTLGAGYGLTVSTGMMEQVASLSGWAVVVAVAAGAAGAQTQVKSDRDSLVSGTAAGFMVAAALAPPAAVLGLSVQLGRWDYAELMAFLLVLQFLAIACGGWLAMLAFGVRPSDASLHRGSIGARNWLLGAVLLGTFALVAWQVSQEPRYRKADLTRNALELTRSAVEDVPGVAIVEAAARFTRADLQRHRGATMLVEVIVEVLHEDGAPGDREEAVRQRVRERLAASMTGVAPLVHVQVLPWQPPPPP